MALFDALISDIAQKFGLGGAAAPLLREVLDLVVTPPLGLKGFLDRLATAGLGPELKSWLGDKDAPALPTQVVERALGSGEISTIANKLGLGSPLTTSAIAYILPKLIGLLTPGGAVPASLPAEVASFRAAGAPVYKAPPAATPVGQETRKGAAWLWPGLAAAAALVAGLFMLNHNATEVKVAPTPVATAPRIGPAEPATPVASTPAATTPVAPAPVAALPAQLSLSNESGVLHYSGSVHDEQTRASIVDALKTAFGADKISGAIGVDPLRAPAAWLGNLGAALQQFKHPGLKAVFDGSSLNLGGIAEQDRNQIMTALKNLFGNGFSFGWLTGKSASVAEWASAANAKVNDSLASLKPGFGAQDLLGVINLSIITFPTAGYDLPAPELALLQKIAGLMRQLPAGTVLEIDGFTDNTGDEAANVVLSQHRADAVRNALVAAGVDASMLTAKGYGSSNPVESNDSEEGRLHNRRIEYHVKP